MNYPNRRIDSFTVHAQARRERAQLMAHFVRQLVHALTHRGLRGAPAVAAR